MILRQLNPHSCKTYLIKEEMSNEIMLIDPVLEHVQDYLTLIDTEKLKLMFVVDTHTHADHISGSAVLKDYINCHYIMGALSPVQCADMRAKEGDTIHFGTITINVLETPGHTTDSISLVLKKVLFTGDALFLDDAGAGRDDLPGGDPGQHWESLQKFKKLPMNLIVYPAHDYKNREPSSLLRQTKHNPHFRSTSREEYIKYLEDLKLGPAEWMKDVLKANYACAMDPKAAWIPADMNACEVKGTLAKGVNEQQVDPIQPDELHTLLESNNSVILLDVREPMELHSPPGYIKNSLNISITKITKALPTLEQYKDKDVILICRSGSRALTAAQILKQVGFLKVRVLREGMIGWTKKGYQVVQ